MEESAISFIRGEDARPKHSEDGLVLVLKEELPPLPHSLTDDRVSDYVIVPIPRKRNGKHGKPGKIYRKEI